MNYLKLEIPWPSRGLSVALWWWRGWGRWMEGWFCVRTRHGNAPSNLQNCALNEELMDGWMDGERPFRNRNICSLRMRAPVHRDTTSVCMRVCLHVSACSCSKMRVSQCIKVNSTVTLEICWEIFISTYCQKGMFSVCFYRLLMEEREGWGGLGGTPDTSTESSKNNLKALRVNYWQRRSYWPSTL